MKLAKKRRTHSKSPRFSRRWLFLSLLALGIVVLIIALSRGDSSSNTKSQADSTAASASGEKQQSGSAATSGSDKTPADSTSASSSQAPKTPYGNFVSSHSVGFDDSESSICLTSANARCQITFSKDGATKSLGEKTADSDGAAYWYWKPQDIGLTAGSWQITASASLNGKSSSATDARNLQIQQ